MTQDMTVRSATDSELLVPVDPDPAALRTLLLVTLVVASVAGYLIAQLLVTPEATCSPLALILGVAMGAGIMRVTEIVLRPRWKSNKYVRLSPSEVAVISGNRKEQAINPSHSVSVHMWHFTVKRATRVPKGWYVVSLALEESDHILPVYCLMSPERFGELPRKGDFRELTGKKDQLSEDRASLRVAGQQRRLLRAEGARDIHGVEMTYDDFVLYMQWIDAHFPEWLPVD